MSSNGRSNGSRPRVVVTGLGAVSPVGNDVPTMWENLINGRSGIDTIQQFDPSPYETRFAGEVRNFDPGRYLERREIRRTDPYVHFAIAATEEAVADAGVEWERIDRERVGVMIGTATGGVSILLENANRLRERGPHRVSPFFLAAMTVDAAGANIAIRYALSGPSYATVSACASGANALGEAAELIRRGAADMVLAGGSEKGVIAPALAGFNVMRALSTRNAEPARASRPFDADRDGFIIAEGAAVMVLESEAHARRRGARIYAELAGYGTNVDGFHMAIPAEEGAGVQRTMRLALEDAALNPDEITYINAHGTSTPIGDLRETEAIKRVFAEGAYDLVVSSTKSMTGHLFGAAGALEGVVCVKAVESGILPPTINYETPDPECDLDYAPNEARELPHVVALSNSMGLGGHNVTLILAPYSG